MTTPGVTAVPPESPGTWLAAQSLARPGELATVMRLIAAGGRSNDSCLHARQFLERVIGAGPEGPLAAADYLHAAGLLHRDLGSLTLGDVMESLAATEGELAATARAWHGRYASRPPTDAERAAEAKLRNREVVESGHAGPGIDGAHYTRAYYPRSGKPAVVVTTSALTEEVVNFANMADAAAWLASRSWGVAGPLRTSATGPASRTAREEEMLAFLIREPGSSARLAQTAGPATFTTHLRAELFTALRWVTAAGGTPGYSVIAEAYGRRLLRAPGAAAADIGWPGATRAMAYLQRLAGTPVTQAQATAAARELAAADAAAARAPRQPAAAPVAAAQPPRAQAQAGKALLQPPPAPVPGPRSPAPRL